MQTHDIIYSNKSEWHTAATLLLSILRITHHRPSWGKGDMLYGASLAAKHPASALQAEYSSCN